MSSGADWREEFVHEGAGGGTAGESRRLCRPFSQGSPHGTPRRTRHRRRLQVSYSIFAFFYLSFVDYYFVFFNQQKKVLISFSVRECKHSCLFVPMVCLLIYLTITRITTA